MHDSVFKLMDKIRDKFIEQDVHKVHIDSRVMVELYKRLESLDNTELNREYLKMYKLELEYARVLANNKLKKLIKSKTGYDPSGIYNVTEVSEILDIPRDLVLLIQRRVLGSIDPINGKKPQGRLSTPMVSRKLSEYLYRDEEEIF